MSNATCGSRNMNHTWGDVSARLRRMGSTCSREVVAEAQAGGCDPDMGISIIDFGESNGHPLGTIHKRLSTARPTLAANFGWPENLPPVTSPEPQPKDDCGQREHERSVIVHVGRRAGVPKEIINRKLVAEGYDDIA